MRNISKIFSWIFHPLLSPFIATVIVLFSGYYLQLFQANLVFTILFIFFIMTFAMPSIIIPLFYYQKLIPDLFLKKRKYRTKVYLTVFVIYAVSFYLMNRFQFPVLLEKTMISYTITLFILSLISFFAHLSAHSAGTGALTGIVLFLIIKYNTGMELFLSALLIISGFVLTSRMILGYHKAFEVYFGYILGLSVMIAAMFVL